MKAATGHTWTNGGGSLPVYLQHRQLAVGPEPLPWTVASVLSLSFPRSVLQRWLD